MTAPDAITQFVKDVEQLPSIQRGSPTPGFFEGTPLIRRSDVVALIEAGLRGIQQQENVLSSPMAAGLLLTLKAECEREHNRAEAAESRYQAETLIVDNVWAALGISTYEQAQGKDIATLVAELRAALARQTQALAEIAEKVRELP